MKTLEAISSRMVCSEKGRAEESAFMAALSEGLVYVDEHLLVLDKPAGLLAVPGRGADKQDCLSARAQRLWPDALVVHRLDMATSGLFVMARGPVVQRSLSMAFESRDVAKRYIAVVAGALALAPDAGHGWGEITLPLMADWPNRPLQKVDHEAGKASVTRWRVAHAEPAATRLELEPVTGRTHQLRVHLAAIGHPIIGDRLYAPPPVQAMAQRLLLHACSITFVHPATGEPMTLESAPAF
jgi:tRNA pseudouridine32 synthase/23S rRNA pseudouridine746 synthase